MEGGEPHSPSAGAHEAFQNGGGRSIVILWARVQRFPTHRMRCADIRFKWDLGESLLGSVLLWIYVNHEL